MSIICDEPDFMPLFEEQTIPKKFKNKIGYFSFYTKDKKVRTYKIRIEEITEVISDDRIIGTFVKYIYFETKIINKIINNIFKTNLKSEQGYGIETGFYSKDYFSTYNPYGFLDLKLIGKDIEDSKKILLSESKNNKDYSDFYRNNFPKIYNPSY